MPSEVISDYSYDERANVLHVTFTSGRRYDYLDVPKSDFEAMRAALSKGQFFNARVRERYRFRRVPPD